MALMRTAKSCGSDAPRLASSLREEAQITVSKKPGHRGEREVSRKTIARGVPGDFRCDRGDYARVLFHFAREAAGASCARHSLRPLTSEGRTFSAKLARKVRRDRDAVSANVRCLKTESGRHHPTGLVVRDARRCRAPHHEGLED